MKNYRNPEQRWRLKSCYIVNTIVGSRFLYFLSRVPCLAVSALLFSFSSNISLPRQSLLCLLCITNRYVNLITYANRISNKEIPRETFLFFMIHIFKSNTVKVPQILHSLKCSSKWYWWCWRNQHFYYFIIINEMKMTLFFIQ